ncbi:MAG: hypothetical protein A2075_02720 [Geobacteraceae bacterium GWC2_58_44]|nr:MAG: hypothetical protein A2075_02720 [Geobacteraceae bacterium GWC2_58_44]HBG05170.1 glycosyl transferase [Geobacter sp.]
MKVLIVSCLYKPYVGGGAEVIIEEHARSLMRQGVEVAILTTGPGAGLALEEVEGIRVWRAGIRNLYFPFGATRPKGWQRMLWHCLDIYNPLMSRYIAEVVERERPDVASCHNITGWSIAAWDAFRALGVPVVQVLHDQYLLCARSTMFKQDRPCRRRCLPCRLMRLFHAGKSSRVSAVVGVSRFILDRLLGYGYFSRTPIRESIPNARSFPFDPAAYPARPDDGTVVFGFIGSLAPNKGIELLLENFLRCAPQNWRLRVAGTGKSDYEAMLNSRFSEARVTFLGHCRPEQFFTGVDITVVPSLWEDTFPGVVFESMLFGVPVIGSRRGGIPEMLLEGETGLLFTPEEPDSLSEAMRSMARDVRGGRYPREGIISHASGFKDQDAWTERWLSVYRRTAALCLDKH